jgi:hypothetical protein
MGMVLTPPCLATFVHAWEPVPLNRLLENVGQYVKQQPNDAKGHYTLGRLHSLAFARGKYVVDLIVKDWQTNEPLALPRFPPYDTILEKRAGEKSKLGAEPSHHLAASIRYYQRATELAPKEGLYWLGLGWMLEQGASFVGEMNGPFLATPEKASADDWRAKALAAYRRAYEVSLPKELKEEMIFAGVGDASIAMEAGEGILRHLQPPLTVAQKAEVARVHRSMKTLQGKLRGVTPIIFPIDGQLPFDALLSSSTVVSFDLAGGDGKERWSWVGPNTGILVWDPEGTGRITSGRQLFGSVTWWIFWEDGYQPLAALDDNLDGWLSGRELEGLAVWRDRNGNAISEAGEVRRLSQVGIVRLAVRAAGRSGEVLYNPRGLERSDGTYLPTYDWMPTSLDRHGRAETPR